MLSGTFVQQDQVFGDRSTDANLGQAVAIDGDLMVVGAYRQTVDGIARAGASFVYRRNHSGTPLNEADDFWQQEARLTGDAPHYTDEFGTSVAISGETVVVGSPGEELDTDGDGTDDAYNAGAAYVFTFDSVTGQWIEETKLTASDAATSNYFGASVAVSGETIVVGSPYDSVDADGDGAEDVYSAGSVHVFRFDAATGQWGEGDKLIASDPGRYDDFGRSVAISGETIAVGSERDSLDSDGDGTLDAHMAGSAYVLTFDNLTGRWSEQAKLTASDAGTFDFFGLSVAISQETIVVGSYGDDRDTNGDGTEDAYNAGAAYVFAFDGVTGLWSEQAKLTARAPDKQDWFGFSVAISGETIVVGSPLADVDADGDGVEELLDAGAIDVFTFDGLTGEWNRHALVTASDIADYDYFGWSVAVSGETIVVGSLLADVDADGDGVEEPFDVGSAYVFVADAPPQVESVEVGGDLRSFHVQLNDDDLVQGLAEDVSNYRILAANGDADGDGDPFNDGDETYVAIDHVSYDPTNDRITIQTLDVLFADHFRVIVDGDDAADGSPGLTDLAGNYLAGGDFTAEFDLTALSLVELLLAKVEALGLSTGADSSLTAKLDAVLTQMDMDAGEDQSLSVKLEAFILGVQRWYLQGQITLETRDDLVEDAARIILGWSLS